MTTPNKYTRILTGTYRRLLVAVFAGAVCSSSPSLAPFSGVHLNRMRLFPRDPVPVEEAAAEVAVAVAAEMGTHSFRHFLTGPVNVIAGP